MNSLGTVLPTLDEFLGGLGDSLASFLGTLGEFLGSFGKSGKLPWSP